MSQELQKQKPDYFLTKAITKGKRKTLTEKNIFYRIGVPLSLSVSCIVTSIVSMQEPLIRKAAPPEFPPFDGTEAAFRNLFNRLFAPLARYANSILQDADDARDAVQQAFFRLWQNRENLNILQPKSYLYQTVYNDCISRVRHSNVKGTYMDHRKRELETGFEQGHTAAESKELEKRIEKAVDELPPQCGQAFKLSRFHQLSYSEIAKVMDISVKTVENHMGKALALMREKLADYLISILLVAYIILLS